ncbi:structural protein [Bacterioplanoides sp.]|uniref:structural protein n=1 Tax=Bacterioplanoides sp. TaxID=2066072 RepID=UPI003B0000E6
MATILIAAGAFTLSGTVRGIRNNNPGNIRKGADWDGAAGDDGAFVIFDSPEFGIRALSKLLLNYERLYGLNTVSGIINRYAPTNENNTLAYVESVAGKLGVNPHEQITVADRLPELVKAIIYHENGQQPYSDDLIGRGIGMAVEYRYA